MENIYLCITKDGTKHEIAAETATQANLIAEKQFGYSNISLPPQESYEKSDTTFAHF